MKTLGLIGGMSWESTVTYYQIINQTVKEKLGGLHSARLILYSVEFSQIEELQALGKWDESGEILADAAAKLETAGADYLLLCTNTMHKVAPQICKRVRIPLLHIAEATADALREAGVERVGLLGTRYTMTQDFYKEKLRQQGIQVLIPEDPEIQEVNRIIFQELCLGKTASASKESFLAIINDLSRKGAQAIILGCTEIGLLIRQEDTPVPLFDTTTIHARIAALTSLRDDQAGDM